MSLPPHQPARADQHEAEPTRALIAQRRQSGLVWPRAVFTLVDLAFIITVVFTFAGTATVFAFHLSFALMTVMGFLHTGPRFLARAVPGTLLVAAGVSRAVFDGQLLMDELHEIPILVAMMSVAAWSMQLHGRLLIELRQQRDRLRRLHAASQLEYREQLVLAQRLETFGQISAGVAHNLRNLLSTVLSMAERIEDESDPEVITDQAKLIQAYTSRGGDLISTMLRHARPNRVTATTDLIETVVREEPALDILAGPDIELDFDLVPGPLPVEISPSLIEQVLVNLVLNARDAMAGRGRITVKATPGWFPDSDLDAPADAAVLSVLDTGPGMPGDVMVKAFEPFFSTKEGQESAGLGLFSALVIAEEAGGTIQIRSDEPSGTEVVMTLPLADSERSPGGRSPDQRLEDLFGTERVLLVDPDDATRDRSQAALTLYGYEVAGCPSAADAIDQLRHHPVDLLVVDVTEPLGEGQQLAREAVTRGMAATVLFTSAEATFDGMDGLPASAPLLTKPYSRNLFLSRVRHTIEQHGMARTGGPGQDRRQ